SGVPMPRRRPSVTVPRFPSCRHIHSWVHSWGQTHTGVVTRVVIPSHESHQRHNRRSTRSGSVPSLHTRWTTLGAERHVDLWMNGRSVHSVVVHMTPLTTKA